MDPKSLLFVFFLYLLQWQVQDFPNGEQPIILAIFPHKLYEIDREGTRP